MAKTRLMLEAEFRKKFKDDFKHKVLVYPTDNIDDTDFIEVGELKIDDKTLREHLKDIMKDFAALKEDNYKLHKANKALIETVENLLGVKL